MTPTASGISVARPRKNRIDSTTSSGNAIISARPRSAATVSPICSPATAPTADRDAVGARRTRSTARLRDRLVVGARPDRRRDEPVVPGAAGRVGRGDAGQVGELAIDRVEPLGRRPLDEQHEARARLGAGGLLDPLDGDLGVGAGGHEAAAALELAGDRAAEHAGEHHEQQDRDEGAARVGRET